MKKFFWYSITRYMSDIERHQHGAELEKLYEEVGVWPGEMMCDFRTPTEDLVWNRMSLWQKSLVSIGIFGISVISLIVIVAILIAKASFN